MSSRALLLAEIISRRTQNGQQKLLCGLFFWKFKILFLISHAVDDIPSKGAWDEKLVAGSSALDGDERVSWRWGLSPCLGPLAGGRCSSSRGCVLGGAAL